MPLEYHLIECWRCGEALHADDPQPHRVQIVELPEVVPVIHYHRFYQLECACCGAWTRTWSDEFIATVAPIRQQVQTLLRQAAELDIAIFTSLSLLSFKLRGDTVKEFHRYQISYILLPFIDKYERFLI